jgi:F-type H+-transporting ATPase subunit a
LAEKHSPLEQFEIVKMFDFELFGYDLMFTNSSLWLFISVMAATIFVVGGMSRATIVPGRWQLMVEMVYEFIANMLNETVGPEARKFFPFVFTLFMFIFFVNVSGMIPGSFTPTSHIAVTAGMAIFVFLSITILGFMKNGLGFLKLFVPSGIPLAIAPLMIVIELISYLVRPMSLSVRLFANMTAGHIMLKVIAGFAGSLGIFAFGPILFNVALTGLELLVAVLQAYVFAMLSCIYLNDAYHCDH